MEADSSSIQKSTLDNLYRAFLSQKDISFQREAGISLSAGEVVERETTTLHCYEV